MHPDLHLRLHAERQAAAVRGVDHRLALARRPRPPSASRRAVAQALHRLADAVAPEALPRRAA